MIHLKSFLKHYKTRYEDELNHDLMNKTNDRPLVDYIVDSWKSLEVVPNIKFIGYTYDPWESHVDVNKFIFKREKARAKKDRADYKYIMDDRCGKLSVFIEVTLNVQDKDTKEIKTHVYPLRKDMLIPIQDEDGYYYIKGKRYYLIYQLLEKSTYTSAKAVTLKSLMPIYVSRQSVEYDEASIKKSVLCFDLNQKKSYVLPSYSIQVFKNNIPVILFYMSKGIDYCLSFLGLNHVISFKESVSEEEYDDSNLYFQLGSRCIMIVNRQLFDDYSFVQSVVAGLIGVSSSRTTIESLHDPKVWIKKISGTNYDKGANILRYFNRLLDETTKKVIKINDYHLEDIYTLLRWMTQEFTVLRMKDNLSLDNKRIRCNEYIASLMTLEFSKRLNRVIALGDKATIDNYRELLRFPGEIIV